MTDARLNDPLGRRLVLRDSTWYGHILKGHPEMARCHRLVVVAVTSPMEIRRSSADADCRVYFGAGPTAGLEVAVVADVVAGIVKTAYLCRKRIAGDVEWSSPTP
jgi:hypothetical protein